ncbi:MAG: HAMP domain-containing protein, partial [Spirochaetes bacterium]|nr:HAMP domain-containing protein [Spirochaetota bacterium]
MRERKFRRIQTTIALAFAVLVFATATVMALLSYNFTQEAVQQTSRDYTTQLIAQVQTNIDSYITHMENIAEVVQVNEEVQAFLETDALRDGSAAGEALPDEALRERIIGFLNSISRTRNDISLILIAGENGRVLTHDTAIELNDSVNIPRTNWYRKAVVHAGSTIVSSSHVQNLVEGEYRWVITLSRTIDDPRTGETHGVMLVDLNYSVINDLLSRISLGPRGYLFIVDATGSIVYHPRQELIYSDLEREHIDRVLRLEEGSFSATDEKGERIYTVSTSRRTGWRTVGVNYASEMVRNRSTIGRYYSYWALICIIAAIFIAVLISHRLSRPLMRLRTSMQSVEQGNFDISVDASSNNEIGDLARDFNIMIAEIKELMRRNAAEQEEKRKSELMALQNQITPHFLYNTLDSVIWMAEGKQYANVVTTVSALARLLRLSISRGEELISIRDEIEHIKSYLTIQKLRYRDKLDFDIDVAEEIMPLHTPKVILQPLVENAIYHGIKNKEGAGHVLVTGLLDGDSVVLEVRDDGVGMSDEQRRTVLGEADSDQGNGRQKAAEQAGVTGPESGTAHVSAQTAAVTATAARSVRAAGYRSQPSRFPRRRRRVGVRNVHERIRLYFGAPYGLSFHGAAGEGTRVEVKLPIVRGDGTPEEEM